jgi:hypothetical protein
MAGPFMNLDESQKKQVATWIAEGLKLSEIQNRLTSKFGVHMTYMEVRLLVNDLKLVPKDHEPPKPPAPVGQAAAGPQTAAQKAEPAEAETEAAPASGGVSVTVDQLARPGTIVSGKVTFSDGNKADWYLDQAGQLGVIPVKKGYKPPAADIQQFEMALETELARMGF